jgi:ribosomal protein L24E
MHVYVCDICGETFASVQPGALSLISGDGDTAHVCSGACHRAAANRDQKLARKLVRRRALKNTMKHPDLWVCIAAIIAVVYAYWR